MQSDVLMELAKNDCYKNVCFSFENKERQNPLIETT